MTDQTKEFLKGLKTSTFWILLVWLPISILFISLTDQDNRELRRQRERAKELHHDITIVVPKGQELPPACTFDVRSFYAPEFDDSGFSRGAFRVYFKNSD